MAVVKRLQVSLFLLCWAAVTFAMPLQDRIDELFRIIWGMEEFVIL